MVPDQALANLPTCQHLELTFRYVLTLLNIMSAIYGDPTLGANLKFVILRLIFYEASDEVGGRNFVIFALVEAEPRMQVTQEMSLL